MPFLPFPPGKTIVSNAISNCLVKNVRAPSYAFLPMVAVEVKMIVRYVHIAAGRLCAPSSSPPLTPEAFGVGLRDFRLARMDPGEHVSGDVPRAHIEAGDRLKAPRTAASPAAAGPAAAGPIMGERNPNIPAKASPADAIIDLIAAPIWANRPAIAPADSQPRGP